MFLFTYVLFSPQRQLNILLENLCTTQDSFAYICMHAHILKRLYILFFSTSYLQFQCFPLTPSHTASWHQQLHDSLMIRFQVPRYQMETFHLTPGVPRSQKPSGHCPVCVSVFIPFYYRGSYFDDGRAIQCQLFQTALDFVPIKHFLV